MKTLTIWVAALALAATSGAAEAQRRLSDAQVKQRIIEQSIASYPGACPCPYNTARNGSRCGGRSAYSRAGGYGPICYASDVTSGDVADWRARN